MCLAIPGKIESIVEGSNPKMAKVDFGGIKKNVCIEFLPEAGLHDYVLVHVGVALTKVDEKEALETIELFKEMGDALDELKEGDPV
ncbi:MAG: HypC/HybG/HupF family hydrogenase formation chaperone [Bacteroidota bacterium]|nr:HypC/HybG/HupF family hydrogenase formation chaperone [Bacteroidota bacterium]